MNNAKKVQKLNEIKEKLLKIKMRLQWIKDQRKANYILQKIKNVR